MRMHRTGPYDVIGTLIGAPKDVRSRVGSSTWHIASLAAAESESAITGQVTPIRRVPHPPRLETN